MFFSNLCVCKAIRTILKANLSAVAWEKMIIAIKISDYNIALKNYSIGVYK